MDAVVTCLNAHPEIWINRSAAPNHWLLLKLVGTRSNRQALGARIKLVPESGPAQFNQVTTSVGFSSSSDDRVHFGLGAAARAKSIEIIWPSGVRQILSDVPADRVLTIVEGK
jgi:enediyne biosynthesis protein E4